MAFWHYHSWMWSVSPYMRDCRYVTGICPYLSPFDLTCGFLMMLSIWAVRAVVVHSSICLCLVSVICSALVICWTELVEIGLPPLGKTQYVIRGPTWCEAQSQCPILLMPRPAFVQNMTHLHIWKSMYLDIFGWIHVVISHSLWPFEYCKLSTKSHSLIGTSYFAIYL